MSAKETSPAALPALTEDQVNDRSVTGDLAESRDEHAEASICRTEAAIRATVIRGPGCHGYNPMMAFIGASLGHVHDARTNRLT